MTSGIKRAAFWIVALAAIGVVAFVMLSQRLTEAEVDAMLASRELVGLTLSEAGERLHHEVNPGTTDGLVIFDDFPRSAGWSRRAVEVEVKDGRIVQARWAGQP